VAKEFLIRLHEQFLADEGVGQVADVSALHVSLALHHLVSAA
jgi:hypothetical protein